MIKNIRTSLNNVTASLKRNWNNNLLDLVLLLPLLYTINIGWFEMSEAGNNYYASPPTFNANNHLIEFQGEFRAALNDENSCYYYFYHSDDCFHTPLIYKYAAGERYILPDDLISGEAPMLTPYGLLLLWALLVLLIFFVMTIFIIGDNVRLFTLCYTTAFVCAFYFLTTQSFWLSILFFFMFVFSILANCVYDIGIATLWYSKRCWGYVLLYMAPTTTAFIILWNIAGVNNDFGSCGGSWTLYFDDLQHPWWVNLLALSFILIFLLLLFFSSSNVFRQNVVPKLTLRSCLTLFGPLPAVASYGVYNFVICWPAEVASIDPFAWNIHYLIGSLMVVNFIRLLRQLNSQTNLKSLISLLSALLLHLSCIGVILSNTYGAFLGFFFGIAAHTLAIPCCFVLARLLYNKWNTYDIVKLYEVSKENPLLFNVGLTVVHVFCLTPGSVLFVVACYTLSATFLTVWNFPIVQIIVQTVAQPDITVNSFNIAAFIAGILYWFIFLDFRGQPFDLEEELNNLNNPNNNNNNDLTGSIESTPQENQIINLFFNSLVFLNFLSYMFFFTAPTTPHLFLHICMLSAIVPVG